MSEEVVRKSIHLSSLAIPIIYSFVTKAEMLWVLIPFTLICLAIDYGRHYIPILQRLFLFLFGSILREHEKDVGKKLLSGGTYVLISACLCIIIFPKVIAITAFGILIVSDAISALIGRRFGRHKFFDKSIEGSLAFFLSACAVVALAPKAGSDGAEFIIGFIAAAVGAIIEAMSVRLKVDDNFSVPSSIGIAMWIGYWLISLNTVSGHSSLLQQLMR